MTSLSLDARLLVIDDDPIVQKLLKALLSKSYPTVTTCSSADEALRLLAQTPYDCVITDAVMPEMSGYDLVKTLRHHPQWKQMPIIMLTRKRHPEDIQRAIKVGVSDYLLKPIDEHLLLDKISLCLNRNPLPRQLFELSLHTTAELILNANVNALSESDVLVQSSVSIPARTLLKVSGATFSEIGIEPPRVRVVDSKPLVGSSGSFLVRCSFIGLQENELMRIRKWLQQQEIRRKK